MMKTDSVTSPDISGAFDYFDAVTLDRVAKFKAFCKKDLGLELEEFQELIAAYYLAPTREMFVMIPRGNTKTTLFAALALFRLVTRPKPNIVLGAASADQASILFEAMDELHMQSPRLEKALRPLHRNMKRRDKKGWAKVVAADGNKQHGIRAMTDALLDELHAFTHSKLYVALKTAMGKVQDAQLVGVSTAGHDEEQFLFQVLEKAREFEDVEQYDFLKIYRSPDKRFVLLEWMVPAGEDLEDATVVKRANPFSGVTVEFLQEQIDSAGLTPWEFARYHANVWTSGIDEWLPVGAWDKLADPDAEIPDGVDVYGAIDAAFRKDSTALALGWYNEDGNKVVKVQIWSPPGNGQPLDMSLVENAVRDAAKKYNLLSVAYDPFAMQRSAQMLEEEGILMVEFPQSTARMAPASQLIYDDVLNGNIIHDGSNLLSSHVKAGRVQNTATGWKLTKNNKKKPIDGLMALVMLVAEMDTSKKVRESVYNKRGFVVLG